MAPVLETSTPVPVSSKGKPAPTSSIDASTLPLAVIDIAGFDPVNDRERAEELADRVVKASHEVGFFYLTGLGIPKEKVESMFKIAAEYYAEPLDQKVPFWMDERHIGYMGIGGQTLDPSGIPDNKELYNMAKWGPQHPGSTDREHPRVLKKYWSELEEFSRLCHTLALKCLQLLALGLRIPTLPDGTPGHLYFEKAHAYDQPSGDTFRFLHYPPTVAVEGVRSEVEAGVRVGAHTDWGSITCLFNDETGGLQIQLPASKEWVHVPPVEGAIVVNLGDLIQFWSSGFLHSTMHRVAPSPITHLAHSRRNSVAYFARPAFSTPLLPIPSPVIDASQKVEASEDVMAPEFGAGGETLTAGEWLTKRAVKSFTKKGLPAGY